MIYTCALSLAPLPETEKKLLSIYVLALKIWKNGIIFGWRRKQPDYVTAREFLFSGFLWKFSRSICGTTWNVARWSCTATAEVQQLWRRAEITDFNNAITLSQVTSGNSHWAGTSDNTLIMMTINLKEFKLKHKYCKCTERHSIKQTIVWNLHIIFAKLCNLRYTDTWTERDGTCCLAQANWV